MRFDLQVRLSSLVVALEERADDLDTRVTS
jgi:hypothetical protein